MSTQVEKPFAGGSFFVQEVEVKVSRPGEATEERFQGASSVKEPGTVTQGQEPVQGQEKG